MREERLFNKDFFRSYEEESQELYQKRILMYQQERKRMARFLPAKGRLLDIGCGLADFTILFGEEWDKYGLEISEYARDTASLKGIKFDLSDQPEGTFDLIIFRGSIHYFPNLKEMIDYAYKMLKPQGLLAILSVPNPNSICYRLFGDMPMLLHTENEYLVGISKMRKVICCTGLQILAINKPYLNTPYINLRRDICAFVLSILGKRKKFAFFGNSYEVYAKKI